MEWSEMGSRKGRLSLSVIARQKFQTESFERGSSGLRNFHFSSRSALHRYRSTFSPCLALNRKRDDPNRHSTSQVLAMITPRTEREQQTGSDSAVAACSLPLSRRRRANLSACDVDEPGWVSGARERTATGSGSTGWLLAAAVAPLLSSSPSSTSCHTRRHYENQWR